MQQQHMKKRQRADDNQVWDVVVGCTLSGLQTWRWWKCSRENFRLCQHALDPSSRCALALLTKYYVNLAKQKSCSFNILILTDNQYKLPNSNDGCMWLRAPTACPEWNEGMDKDVIILHWLRKNAGLTSECVTEVIELFARRWLENTITGKTWNEAAKCAAVKQVTWPHPRPVKAVESTTALLLSTFEQYTLLEQLSDAAKAQTKPIDYAMVINEPAKPVADSSKHPDDADVVDGELIY